VRGVERHPVDALGERSDGHIAFEPHPLDDRFHLVEEGRQIRLRAGEQRLPLGRRQRR